MHVRVIVRMQQRSHFIRHRQFELRPLLIFRFWLFCPAIFVIVRSFLRSFCQSFFLFLLACVFCTAGLIIGLGCGCGSDTLDSPAALACRSWTICGSAWSSTPLPCGAEAILFRLHTASQLRMRSTTFLRENKKITFVTQKIVQAKNEWLTRSAPMPIHWAWDMGSWVWS